MTKKQQSGKFAALTDFRRGALVLPLRTEDREFADGYMKGLTELENQHGLRTVRGMIVGAEKRAQ